jgi:hypothetical protein
VGISRQRVGLNPLNPLRRKETLPRALKTVGPQQCWQKQKRNLPHDVALNFPPFIYLIRVLRVGLFGAAAVEEDVQ